MSKILKTLAPVMALALTTSVAQAHVSIEQQNVVAGSSTKLTFRVPHGCDGSATHTVTVTLPEGIYAAKPMPKPGWDLTTTISAYETPYDNHGTEMTEGVREISWSGGHLEDAWYDEFTVRGSVGPNVEPGTLILPITQICDEGRIDWSAGEGEEGDPAPTLTIVAASGDRHGHGHDHGGAMATPATGEAVTFGDLTLEGAFSRATLPIAPVAGGFMTITNTGDTDDRLIGAASEVADRMEIHEMAMDGDVMRMRELADGLAIPAGETVELKPGGYHLMFMDLSEPLVEGETVEVTLTFENAGEVVFPLSIGAPDADGRGHGHH
ncbi:MAG: copper chaperone PCu(A)C [Pseudomonadota bacterium]|nr:copper chaperone PCu(A)C [Pseudomonadota bacterium]